MRPVGPWQMSDPDLMDRFVDERDESAFAALVERHGRMVRAVCERVLNDGTSADDAFQATFLVLAARAASLRKGTRPGATIGPWLHRVAHNAAIQIRRSETARSRRQRIAALRSHDCREEGDLSLAVLPVLDEEMQRLPETYREPLVLFYLEEKSQQEAANELGLTVATLRRRIERGKELLRRRLVKRGIAVSVFLLGEILRRTRASAAPCTHSFGAVIAAKSMADRSAIGLRAVPGLSAPALSLGQAVIRTMGLRTLARAIGLATAPALILLATAIIISRSAETGHRPARPATASRAADPPPGRVQVVADEPEPPRILRPEPAAKPTGPGRPPGRSSPEARKPRETPEPAGDRPRTAAADPPRPTETAPVAPAVDPGPAGGAGGAGFFAGEININGKVTRFDDAAAFKRAQAELMGPADMGLADPTRFGGDSAMGRAPHDSTGSRHGGPGPSPPGGQGFSFHSESRVSAGFRVASSCCCEERCTDDGSRSTPPAACRCGSCPAFPMSPGSR